LLSVFRRKIFLVHPSDRLPFPLEFCNHNGVLETHSGGATRPRRKSDDIFIRFDTIPVCDGHATTAIAVLAHSVARVKMFKFTRYLIQTKHFSKTSTTLYNYLYNKLVQGTKVFTVSAKILKLSCRLQNRCTCIVVFCIGIRFCTHPNPSPPYFHKAHSYPHPVNCLSPYPSTPDSHDNNAHEKPNLVLSVFALDAFSVRA